jgi:hypothetical protein
MLPGCKNFWAGVSIGFKVITQSGDSSRGLALSTTLKGFLDLHRCSCLAVVAKVGFYPVYTDGCKKAKNF